MDDWHMTVTNEPGAPEARVLRQALLARAFNPATRDTGPPADIGAALDWAEHASPPVADLEDTATRHHRNCGRAINGQAPPSRPAPAPGHAWRNEDVRCAP
jgi:hypothetical protein